MAAKKVYGAIDLGATSGRVIQVDLSADDKISFEVLHRFIDKSVSVFDNIYWCFLGFYSDVLEGLGILGRKNKEVSSIGVDTWGTDCAFFDQYGNLISSPYNYKTPKFGESVVQRLFAEVGKKELYFASGEQHMLCNTIYRMYAIAHDMPEMLERTKSFLMLPDAINYLMTGQMWNEYTNATTSGFFRGDHKGWNYELLGKLGIPSHFLKEVSYPGERRAPLLPELARELSLPGTNVTSVASHDTASAVTATPTQKDNFLFVSSGTQSLMGTEIRGTLLTETTYRYNLANEGGALGTNKLLKNILGMYTLEELRRQWAKQGLDTSYEFLLSEAEKAPALRSFIDPDEIRFFGIGHMQETIDGWMEQTGQPKPETQGQYVRCVLESLAMKYRYVADLFRDATGNSFDTMHIIGGGSRNNLMNQFAANAVNAHIYAGPEEATSVGNALMQIAVDHGIKDIKELRKIVMRSVPIKEFDPQDREQWEQAYQYFRTIVDTSNYNFD